MEGHRQPGSPSPAPAGMAMVSKPHKYQQGRRGRPSPTQPCVVCGIKYKLHPKHDRSRSELNEGEPSDLLRLSEVARRLSVSYSYLDQTLIPSGEIREVKLAKNMRRITRRELARYLDELEARGLDGV